MCSTYKYVAVVNLIYAAVAIGCGASLSLMWWYASKKARLVRRTLPAEVQWSMARRIAVGPALALVAIAIGFVNVRLAHIAFLASPFFYFSHRVVDEHWTEPDDPKDSGFQV